jgi:hypothetical protein
MKNPSWQPPRPIAQAPIEKADHYGPWLLSPGANGDDWALGKWMGEGWWTLDGEHPLAPTHYFLLPPRSVIDG